MPSTPDIDERYSELVTLVRATRPRAPEALRARVRTLPSVAPEPERRRVLTGRRLALVFVAAALVAVAGVVAENRGGGGGGGEEAAVGRELAPEATVTSPALGAPGEAESTDALRSAGPPAQDSAGATLPPSQRIQNYRADLTVRVADVAELSRATASAMRTARSLGGYVVTARYDTPGDGEGDSYLVVRVPIARVQDAILRFTRLGTIVAQSIQVEDLQARVNRQTKTIGSLRRTITRLEELLKDPALPIERRAELEIRLANAKDQLARAIQNRDQTVQRGRLARIALTLTTREEIQPVEPKRPGYFERTIRDAAGALEKVGAWIVAAAIVGGPFVLLLAGLLVADRRRRRRSDERLLDRPQP